MPLTGYTVSVPSGCGSVVFVGTFPTPPYQAFGNGATWGTEIIFGVKTATQIPLTFTVVNPGPSAGSLDLFVGTLP